MNHQDRKDLELVIYRLDEQDKKREELAADTRDSIDALYGAINEHSSESKRSFKFIKENLFDPEKGLWAETKVNSHFRVTITRALWFIFPTSIITALKLFYDGIKANIR